MRYKDFGTTGLKVSAIGVGTWGVGGRGWGGSDREGSIQALRAMFDAGVNLVDTAPAYNRGLAEEITGEAIQGIRDKVIITTKCGMNIDKPGWAVKTATWDEVIRGCEGSLMRMGLDYVDVLLLHILFGQLISAKLTEDMARTRHPGVKNIFSDMGTKCLVTENP